MFFTTGKCLCGSVHFKIETEKATVGLCHCKMCRRWSGGMPIAVISASVELIHDATLSWWRSSDWGERGFCRQCGSVLFWRTVDNAKTWAISVGTLEDEKTLSIKEHIYIDDKATFYELSDSAPRYTGALFTAKTLAHLATVYGDDFIDNALEKMRHHAGEDYVFSVKALLPQFR